MSLRAVVSAVVIRVVLVSSVIVTSALAQDAAVFDEIDRTMEHYRLDAHIPGMVWGIVQDGRLMHVKGAGVQDIDSKRPVTAETLFRIASMTKAFTALTILQLRDEGKLALDAPVETYVPELRTWKYPTNDSPKVRVRELLTHTAGFVTDDPWGDRQTPLPEDAFTRLLRDGVPFTRPPAMAMEYSNLGYALLGRIVANVSGQPYASVVQRLLFTPLSMTSTGYDVAAAPAERRALGYRWEDNAWKLEPTMAHGAFGAMGGIQTSATDYAKWVAYLLSAWPPRDGADAGPVRRASVRELAQGANFAAVRVRPGSSGPEACREASAYGMGFYAATDCELGLTLSHGGGYPGYGSHVLLLPDYGVGIFALANRTYAGPRPPVWDAAVTLLRAERLKPRSVTPSPALKTAYAAAAQMFTSGSVTSAGDVLAMNFLMDRDAEHRARDLAELQAQLGACDTASSIAPTGALAGDFSWRCEHGRVTGQVLLAPTPTPRIQSLTFTPSTCAQATTSGDLRTNIDAAVTDILTKTGAPSASVAAVIDGRIAYTHAYGVANLAANTPATPAMRYSIGSISKQFTATAILLLAEEGKLSLDDPVARWLPDLTRASEVTVRQILSMTSGYQDYWPQDYVMPPMLKPVTAQAILAEWARKPLDFEPGTRWQYSNTNYVIAGLIVEKASGVPLLEFLSKRVFGPLGMTTVSDIDSAPLGPADPERYLRYALGPPRPAPKEGKGWLFAAGELAMTAGDLARWDVSMIDQTVLRPASYRDMQTDVRLANGTGTRYGLGVAVTTTGGRRMISHGGEVSGFTAQNQVYPDDRAAVVVLVNLDASNASGQIATRVSTLLFDSMHADGPRMLERAQSVFLELQQGRIDRSLFTANANAYFDEATLKDFAASLGPLGTPVEFVEQSRSLRGGMSFFAFRIRCAQKTVVATVFVTPDGHLEQFQVAPQQD